MMLGHAVSIQTLALIALALACMAAGLFLLCLAQSGGRRARSRRFEEFVRDESLADQRKWWVDRWGGKHAGPEAGSLPGDEDAQLLARAGFRRMEARAAFWILRLLMAGLCGIGAIVYATLDSAPIVLRSLLLQSFMWAVAGFFVPKFLLRRRARARLRRIDEEVGPFADVLCVLFDVGLSLEQCLRVILSHGGSIVQELRAEIELALRQISAGADRVEALHSVTADLGVEELSNMIKLLSRIEKHSGSVQEPLRQFSRNLDDRRRTALQERVSKLWAKMTMVVIVFLFPALLLFIGGPGFIALKRALEGARG